MALSGAVFVPSLAFAQDTPRRGGRFGIALQGGYAAVSDVASTTRGAGVLGTTLRFGGAVSDRFHILGELTLWWLPGATSFADASATSWSTSLSLLVQGYVLPRLFLRAGAGVGWLGANVGNTWFLPLPGPRVSGAVGYDLWRNGEDALSVSVDVAYTSLSRTSGHLDDALTAGAAVGYDWY